MNILIVNPFSSTTFLSESFRRLNIKTTALYMHNPNNLDHYILPRKDDFTKQIFVESDCIEDVYTAISDDKYDYVLNGSDNSVELTDQLATKLAPIYANDTTTAIYRSDKGWMHKKLEENKLKFIKQVVIDIHKDKLDQLIFTYPCFVKPLSGVASYGAEKIDNHKQLIRYFNSSNLNKLQAKLTPYTTTTNATKFLICEYIEGKEFIVDSYSQNGVHYIAAVQTYCKQIINNIPMYRSLDMVPQSAVEWNDIVNYVKQCLTAVGLNNGFAHSEIFLTKNGPVLIEINPRISRMKGFHNKLTTLSGFMTQPELLVHHVINQKIQHSKTNTLNWRVLQLFHFSKKPVPDVQHALSCYSAVKEVVILREIGFIHATMPCSLADMVAIVVCGSDNLEELEQQVTKILKQDEHGW